MLILFDVIIFIYGVYTIYSSIMMKQTGKLNSWFTGPSGANIRDVKGYIDYIYGRTIVMGAMAAVFGVVCFIHDYVMPLTWLVRALVLLFLTVCIWFFISINRAKRRFW